MIKTTKTFLVGHHIDSFNSFIEFVERLYVTIKYNDGYVCHVGRGNVFFRQVNVAKDCLLRNGTHGCNVFCNIEIEKDDKQVDTIKNVFLFHLPLMVGGILSDEKVDIYDMGGYFVIKGKELCFKSYETYDVKNRIILNENRVRFGITEIINNNNNNLSQSFYVVIKGIEIPLFIVMRALGITSDEEAIYCCILNNRFYEDCFYKSVEDSEDIFSEFDAIRFIGKKIANFDIVNDILPEYNESTIEKAYFLGYMVYRLLSKPKHVRNSKTVILCGTLLLTTFQSLLTQQLELWKSLLTQCVNDDIQPTVFNVFSKKFNIIDDSFQKVFESNYFEDLNRNSYFSYVEQLRTIWSENNDDNECIHFGYFSIAQTPTKPNKQLSLSTIISSHYNFDITEIIMKTVPMVKICEIVLSSMVKVFLNGIWIGCTCRPLEALKKLRELKRNGLLNALVTTYFHFILKELHIDSCAGRLLRPLFYIDNKDVSYKRDESMKEKQFQKDCTQSRPTSTSASSSSSKTTFSSFWKSLSWFTKFDKSIDGNNNNDKTELEDNILKNIDLSDMLQDASLY